MPENVGIAITLNGDVSPLEHATGSGVKSLQDFEAAINKTTRSMGSIAPASVKAGKALEGVKKSSGQATGSLIDLGRVVQDAPFGFIGIANNLNPLFEGFARLRKESGGLKGALAAMGGALAGPAGIGLAISVASSLLITFGDRLFKTKSAAEGAAEAIKKQKEALSNFVDGLDDINKARVTGGQNAQEEIVKLNALYGASQNINLSYAERKKAVDALQEQYPKYFANLTDEALLAGRGKEAYDKLTTAIIASARARAQMKILQDIQEQLLAVEEKRTNAQTALTKAQTEEQRVVNKVAKDALNTRKASEGAAISGSVRIQKETSKVASAQKVVNDLLKQESDLRTRAANLAGALQSNVVENGVKVLTDKVTDKLKKVKPKKGEFNFFDEFFTFSPDKEKLTEKEMDGLMDAANSFSKEFGKILEGLNFFSGKSAFTGKTGQSAFELAKEFWNNYRKGIIKFKPGAFNAPIDLSRDMPDVKIPESNIPRFLEGLKQGIEKGEDKSFGDLDNADELKQRVLNKYRDIFTSVGQSLPKTIKVGNIEVPLNLVTNIGIIDAQLKAEAERIKGLINGLNDQVADFIRNTQVEIAASVGESIGTALAGGDVKGIFANLYTTLGTAMQSLGKSLIATSIGLKAIKEAFKTLNPVVAAAAGVALIALGSALKSSIAKAAPFAQGGLVFGPTMGLVGEGAGTSRNNPEIIAPLDKLQNFLGGGQQPIVLETRIRGNDILLSNARTSKRNRRGG